MKQIKLNHEGLFDYYLKEGSKIIARQQLDTLYHRNGIAYSISRECLKKLKSIKGNRSGVVLIDEKQVNIDTQQDLEKANYLFKK